MFAAAGEQSRTGHLDLAVVLDAHRYQRAPRPRRGRRGAPALILQPHLAGGPARPTPPLKTTSGTRQTPSWDAHHLADPPRAQAAASERSSAAGRLVLTEETEDLTSIRVPIRDSGPTYTASVQNGTNRRDKIIMTIF